LFTSFKTKFEMKAVVYCQSATP